MKNPSRVEGDEDVIRVSGTMLFDTVPGLRKAGLDLIRAGSRTVDLREVSNADSSSLALLMEWERAAEQSGVRLRFQRVPAQILEIARLSEVDQVLDLNP